MRVLVFTSLFPSQLCPNHGLFVYQRVAHWARRPGNHVQVMAPVPYFPAWRRWTRWYPFSQIPKREQIGNLTVYHPRYLLLPKVAMPLHGLLMFLGSLPRVWRLKKEAHFDWIDAHYVYPDGFAAVLLGKLLRIPVMLTARGTDINLFPAFRLIRGMIVWALRRTSGVIAVSGALKRAMVALGISPESIRVIGNGVDSERFRMCDRGVARERLGLAENIPLVVSVGNLVACKGFSSLIAAVAQLLPRYPDVRLYIVGDGPLRGELERLCHRLGVSSSIRFVGQKPQKELPLWYNAADVSCLASSREGWPNVLLESLACGTPVVATRVGGVPEILTSSELGFVVEQEPAALAAGVEQALRKEWDRAGLVRYARARTWKVVAEEVESWFELRKPPTATGAKSESAGLDVAGHSL